MNYYFQVSLNSVKGSFTSGQNSSECHERASHYYFVSAHGLVSDPDWGSVRLLWFPLHCRAVSVRHGEANSSRVE